VVDVTEWKRVMVDGVDSVRDMTGNNPMTVQPELALVPSPFEEAQSELAQVPVNGGGNGDVGNQRVFECLVEALINHGWAPVEFWEMWGQR
jgi:hypothetical protein